MLHPRALALKRRPSALTRSKGLQVLADDGVEDGVFGVMGLIRARNTERSPDWSNVSLFSRWASHWAAPYLVGPVIARTRQGCDKPMQGRITCQVNFLHSNRR